MRRRSQSSPSPSSSSLALSRVLSLVLSVVLAACGSGDPASPATVVSGPSGGEPRITLLDPDSGSIILQNDASTGCPAHPDRGAGFRLRFDWHDVPGAALYKVVFWQRDAEFAAVERTIATSEYTEIACNAFVIDRNLQQWRWHVTALGPTVDSVPGSSAPRDSVLRSDVWSWSFAPCRLASGVACNAPAAGTVPGDPTPTGGT